MALKGLSMHITELATLSFLAVLSYKVWSFQSQATQALKLLEPPTEALKLLEPLSEALKLLEPLSESLKLLEPLSDHVAQAADKLSHLEPRLDRATCTVRDSLRHLASRIQDFDPVVGYSSVLKKLVLLERDNWLLRRGP